MRFWCLILLPLFLCSCFKTRSEISGSEDKKTSETQISSLQQQRADQEARMQDNEASLRQFNGRLEALEQRQNQDFANKQKDEGGSQQTQKQLVEQMKIFEDSLQRLELRVIDLEQGKQGSGKAAGKATAKDDDSTYIQGEQLLKQKQWAKAILAYQKYRDENPKGKKFGDATYKIGACFQEMGKNSEASAFYSEVVEKFPKSDAARKAVYRLKTLK